MKQTFDTDAILYGILEGTPEITSAISGGVYVSQRPMNSDKEDVVVNTIDLTQNDEPQIGTSNINIHVPDMPVKISGKQQKVADSDRMKAISALVLDAIRTANVPGLLMEVQFQTVIQEAETEQHYVNIRISWNIH